MGRAFPLHRRGGSASCPRSSASSSCAAAASTSSIDPIDGSLNAKRGIPFFACLARDRGRRRGWATSSSATSATTARARSGGPRRGVWRLPEWLAGSTARCPRDSDRDALFEATRTARRREAGAWSASPTDAVMGSLALSLCHLAGGPGRRRLLAEAGALGRHRGGPLLVRERGLALDLVEDGRSPRPRSTSRPVAGRRGRHGGLPRLAPRPGRNSASGRRRRDPDRLLGLELRALAERRLLPARLPARAGSSFYASASTRSR